MLHADLFFKPNISHSIHDFFKYVSDLSVSFSVIHGGFIFLKVLDDIEERFEVTLSTRNDEKGMRTQLLMPIKTMTTIIDDDRENFNWLEFIPKLSFIFLKLN